MSQPDADAIADAILENGSCAYSRTLGLTYTEATRERVRAELTVTDAHVTVPDILHGGAVMSIADDMGAVGTVLNLPAGARTSTIESKTNFLRGVPLGEKALGEATPLHIGRTTMVWQTRISREGRQARRRRHPDPDRAARELESSL